MSNQCVNPNLIQAENNFFFVGGRTSSMIMWFGNKNLLDFQRTSVPECPKYDSYTIQIQYTSIEHTDFRWPCVSLQTEDFELYLY
jgi:hypothetical protein